MRIAISALSGRSSTSASSANACSSAGDSNDDVGGTAVSHATCEGGDNPLSDFPNTGRSFPRSCSTPPSVGLVTDKLKAGSLRARLPFRGGLQSADSLLISVQSWRGSTPSLPSGFDRRDNFRIRRTLGARKASSSRARPCAWHRPCAPPTVRFR